MLPLLRNDFSVTKVMYKLGYFILIFTLGSVLHAALSSDDIILGANPAGIDFIDNLNDDSVVIGERKRAIPQISISTKDSDENEVVVDDVPILEHQFWPNSPSYLYLRDKPLPNVITDFCKMQDIDVVLSDKLKASTQKVNQSFERVFPVEIWNRLVKSNGLMWFWDGHILFVYESGESITETLQTHPQQIEPTLTMMKALGFYGSNMGLNYMKEGGIIVASGAPKYIQFLKDMTEKMKFYQNVDTDTVDVFIFTLKHAWADDKTVGNITVPGVANLLTKILGDKEQNSDFNMQLPQQRSAQKVQSIKEESLQDKNNAIIQEEPMKIDGLPSGGLIMTDTRQNAIIVKDFKKNFSLYEKLIEKLDIPLELIEIQAAIVNVDKNSGLSLGVNTLQFGKDQAKQQLKFQPISSESSNDTFNISCSGIVNGREFMTQINCLESSNHSKILARPSVITMNNIAAIMDNKRTYYLPVSGSGSESSGDLYSISGSTSLSVTPHIISDELSKQPQIQLILNIKDENMVPVANKDDKVNVYSSSISTQAVVYEGQSVLVGGYFNESYKDEASGVPFLKDVPLLGSLFKTTAKNKTVSERLFLITPKIIRLSYGQDDYEGLFQTPSSLLTEQERISTQYVRTDNLLIETQPIAESDNLEDYLENSLYDDYSEEVEGDDDEEDYEDLELALALNTSDQKVSEKKNSRTQRLLAKQEALSNS